MLKNELDEGINALNDAIGDLVVANEDIGGDYDDGGEDLDTGGNMAVIIKRPDRDEWITLRPTASLTVRLHKAQKEGREFDYEYFYVAPAIRKPVAGDLRPFLVIPYFSWLRRRTFLFVTTISEPGASTWTDSLAVVVQKSPEWHAKHAVRIQSNKEAARYEAKQKPVPGEPVWPADDTGRLLGDALGKNRFITSTEHPVYQRLLEGEVLI